MGNLTPEHLDTCCRTCNTLDPSEYQILEVPAIARAVTLFHGNTLIPSTQVRATAPTINPAPYCTLQSSKEPATQHSNLNYGNTANAKYLLPLIQ